MNEIVFEIRVWLGLRLQAFTNWVKPKELLEIEEILERVFWKPTDTHK